MKKLALLVPGVGAAVAIAVIGAGQASAQAPNVIGETYGKAVALLRASGYTAVFAGSVGSDLPQSQCIVIDQQGQSSTNTWNPTGTAGAMRLRLDCNVVPGQNKPPAPGTRSMVPPGGSAGGAGGAGGGPRPTPGAGTVTVTPVPIG